MVSCSQTEVKTDTEVIKQVAEEQQPEVKEDLPVPPKLEIEEEPEEEVETAPIVAESKSIEVKTSGLSFSPDEVTINSGDTVKFITGGSHNAVEVTEDDWDAGKKTAKVDGFSVGFGETKEITFDSPGTYYYVCQPHAALGMKGKIIVK